MCQVLHDLKDGSLVRRRNSVYRSREELESLNNDEKSEVGNYLNFIGKTRSNIIASSREASFESN